MGKDCSKLICYFEAAALVLTPLLPSVAILLYIYKGKEEHY